MSKPLRSGSPVESPVTTASEIAVASIPFALEPIAVPRVWGGSRLREEIHPGLPDLPVPIGETWEVSDYGPDGALHSRITTGPARGQALRDLLTEYPVEVLGSACPDAHSADPTLPLLFKFIDAQQNLSVQVHPDDAVVRARGLQGLGKAEAWVILDAKPGAKVWCGLEPGVSHGEFLDRASAGDLRGLREIQVKRGDFLHLPAGTVHAIGAGVLLAEIQQSSDITYRIHDWGRLGLDGKPRDLHLAEAALVSPPEDLPPAPLPEPSGSDGPLRRRIDSPEFVVDEIRMDETGLASAPLDLPDPGQRFGILSVLSGSGVLECPEAPGAGSPDGEILAQELVSGGTWFVPAGARALRIHAKGPLWALWMQPGITS